MAIFPQMLELCSSAEASLSRIRFNSYPCQVVKSVALPGVRRRNCSSVLVRSATESAATTTYSEQGQERRTTSFDWNSEWYPVAIVQELDKRVPQAVTILGYELVLWWDRSGKKWQAFSDKCPHRLAPLSEGRISENGHLQCSYHGWTFAPGGAGSGIPQADQIKNQKIISSSKACVRAYPCLEQQGILWVSLDATADHKIPPPFFPVLEDGSFVHYWATSDVPYGYEALIENLMDPTHVPFAHHKLQGNRKNAKPVSYSVNKFDRYGFRGTTGKGDGIFMPPCSFMLDINIPPKNKEEDPKKTKKFVTIFMCVPISPGRSKMFWSFPRNFAKWVNFLTPMWLAHLRHMLVLDSDLYLLHVLERKQRADDTCYTPTSADTFVMAFRRWLSVYAGGSPNYAPHVERSLPPSPSKKQLMDRYENHVKRCPTCLAAKKFFKLAEVALQVLAIFVTAVAASARSVSRVQWGVVAALLWISSRWTARFVDKNYHFHDYNHALVK